MKRIVIMTVAVMGLVGCTPKLSSESKSDAERLSSVDESAVATMKFGPVTIPSGAVIPELRTRGSFTMVKEGELWKIAHFQNTNIDADAEKNDPITCDETGFLPGRKEP